MFLEGDKEHEFNVIKYFLRKIYVYKGQWEYYHDPRIVCG